MRTLSTIALLCAAATANAQSNLPPIQKLPAPSAVSGRDYKSVPNVRTLPNGTLFVNDPGAHRLLLVDTNFTLIKVVADTVRDTDVQFGLRPVSLMPYLGDSTLFVETMTPEMYVLDVEGHSIRRMAPPNPRDAGWLPQSLAGGWASTDATGRILYRGASPRVPMPTVKPGDVLPFAFADSAPILRADLTTRTTETIAWYRIRKIAGNRVGKPDGTAVIYITNDPTAATDEFVVLSDGMAAILRADYHVDVINADGMIKSGPRIAYPWHRLTDSAKVALMDSIRKESDASDAARAGAPAPTGSSAGVGGGNGLAGGASREPAPDYSYARPERLADYMPAFGSGAVHADARGNLWVQTLQHSPTATTSIYDVVTRDGKLLERIEIPDSRTIVGFDATYVYMTGRENGATWIERIRIP